ncbi:MAG: glycerophosphodiester phosphodiesterase [Candidatus Kapaibacteriota bacterium]|jgi:glycerophosphoryl diester phosphodiesterase
MKTIYEAFEKLDFFVVAHRGASSAAPENTLASFRKAISVGAHFIELDIQTTRDHVPIVFHDKGLSRTTNGVGFASKLTFEELKKLDSGFWFGKEFSGEHIPSFEEVLQLVQGKIFLNVELKNLGLNAEQHIHKILGLIYKYDFNEKVVVSSFYYEQLKIIKTFDPKIPIAPIRLPKDIRLPSQLKAELNCDGYVCSFEELNREIAEDAARSNLFIGVYSVDSEEQLNFAVSHDVKAIVTNNPEKILKLLKTKYKARV